MSVSEGLNGSSLAHLENTFTANDRLSSVRKRRPCGDFTGGSLALMWWYSCCGPKPDTLSLDGDRAGSLGSLSFHFCTARLRNSGESSLARSSGGIWRLLFVIG